MKRMNFPGRKAARRDQAAVRQERYDKRSINEKYALSGNKVLKKLDKARQRDFDRKAPAKG